MDWIAGLQKAVDYVEEHLTEEIDSGKVAAVGFSSSYHFQRVFSILCGYTLGEYIRLRRLSLAGAELANGREKVIDVALKYGYDSPDSFAKAFRAFHGITPSQARADGRVLKSFSRLSIKISLEGGSTMNYRIEEKKEMILTGYKRRFRGVPGERFEQEQEMYLTTRPLQYLVKGVAGDLETTYNVVSGLDDDGYDFMIAARLGDYQRENLTTQEILGEEFGRHFEHITIPAGTYAIFETDRSRYPTETFLNLRRRIVSEWLPGTEYRLADAPELAVYHWFREQKDQRYIELWIPIEKK